MFWMIRLWLQLPATAENGTPAHEWNQLHLCPLLGTDVPGLVVAWLSKLGLDAPWEQMDTENQAGPSKETQEPGREGRIDDVI